MEKVLAANLMELRKWFPSGTAEGEREILDKVFVYVREFERIMAPPTGNPYLLIGKKGSGKSAVLDFAMKFLSYQATPAIFLRPSDIDTSFITESDSISEINRKLSPILLSAIAAKLAESKEDFLTGDLAVMYNEAVRSGYMSPSVIGKISRALSGIAKPLIKVDLDRVFPVLTTITKSEVERAVSNLLLGDRLYIFVDDSDQIANPERSGHLNRVWGLILAIRALTERIPQIKAIVTLRTEVWERLRTDRGGNRDQTDHFTNLTVTLDNEDDHIQRIVERRLTFAEAACPSKEGIYPTFFEADMARAPFSEDYRSWINLVLVRSRQRPRDAIQLVSKLAESASRRSASKIDESDLISVMPVFSEDRAVLFSQEVEAECPCALDILRSFSQAKYKEGGFRLTADEAKAHLASLPSRFSIQLFGRTLQPSVESDIFDLWKFLYLSGVLNARVSDSTAREGYRHVIPEANPLLVSKSRWNEMQQHLWEINPAYRDYLIIQQREDSKKTGLPIRRTKSRGRGNR